MVGIPSRHKSLVLLAGVILLQVVLLAVQIKRDSQGRLIRVWTVGVISPFQRAGTQGVGSIRGIWNTILRCRILRGTTSSFAAKTTR